MLTSIKLHVYVDFTAKNKLQIYFKGGALARCEGPRSAFAEICYMIKSRTDFVLCKRYPHFLFGI